MASGSLPKRFCVNCGEKLLEGAQFCGNCGKPVITSSETSVSPSKPDITGTKRPMGWESPTREPMRTPPYQGYPPSPYGQTMLHRPIGVTFTGIIMIVTGAFLLFMGGVAGFMVSESMYYDTLTAENPDAYEEVNYDDFKFAGYIMLFIGLLLFIPPIFLLRRDERGRISSMIVLGLLAILSILLFPVGLIITVPAGYAVYYLNKPEIKTYFAKQPDLFLPPPEQLQ